jgi:hypothetical protein
MLTCNHDREEKAGDGRALTGTPTGDRPQGRDRREPELSTHVGDWQEGRTGSLAGPLAHECDREAGWRRWSEQTRAGADHVGESRRYAAAYWLIRISKDNPLKPWSIENADFLGKLLGVEIFVAGFLILENRRMDSFTMAGPKYFLRVYGMLRLVGETAVIGWWWL